MTSSQEIQVNRIIKKLEDVKNQLKELAYRQSEPLNAGELDNVESALIHVNNAINCF